MFGKNLGLCILRGGQSSLTEDYGGYSIVGRNRKIAQEIECKHIFEGSRDWLFFCEDASFMKI